MRIALVSDCYPPRVGGIEMQVKNLAHALVDAGCEVTVITATPSGTARGDHLESDGSIQIRRLTKRLPFDLPLNPTCGLELRKTLPTFDVVHIHMGIVSQFAQLATRTCLSLGIPTVLTWHSHLVDARLWYGKVNPLHRWDQAGMVLTAVSSAAAKALRQAASSDRDRVSVSVLPNLIHDMPWESARLKALNNFRHPANAHSATTDTTAQNPVLSNTTITATNSVTNQDWQASPGAHTLNLVTATRLSRRKRVIPLVKLVTEASQQGTNLALDIFGKGPQKRRLQSLINAGAPVTLQGAVGLEQLAAAYVQADVFVSPVVKEAFGIAALEARACGLPVVYRQKSGISDFITDGFDGLEVHSDRQMAQALHMLARQPQRLAYLRSNALQNKPKFTWKDGLESYLRIYAQAIEKRAGTPNRI